jgi:hypothetical protein
MVYDVASNCILLFGGALDAMSTRVSNELWRYSLIEAKWELINVQLVTITTTSYHGNNDEQDIPALYGHTMTIAYDDVQKREYVYVIGGCSHNVSFVGMK